MRVKNHEPNLERMSKFFSEVIRCNLCTKCEICCDPDIKPAIDIRNARLSELEILFISEAGSAEDVEYKVPFVGLSGMLFRKALMEAGVADSSVAFTNAVVCRPYDPHSNGQRIPTIEELENCSERIEKFIEHLQPKAIVLVGTVARDYYSQKLAQWDYQGKVHLIYHPAYILRAGGSKAKFYPDWVQEIASILKEHRQ